MVRLEKRQNTGAGSALAVGHAAKQRLSATAVISPEILSCLTVLLSESAHQRGQALRTLQPKLLFGVQCCAGGVEEARTVFATVFHQHNARVVTRLGGGQRGS